MARAVDEWIGKRRRGDLTASHMKAWSELDESTGCWNWKRCITTGGYGAVRDKGKTKRAHRRSYELHNSCVIPDGIDCCHSCDNRRCVNPDHLFLGTRKDNMSDCAAKGRIVIPMMRGESLTQSKLTEDDVRSIKSSSLSTRKMAAMLGVDRATISQVRNGKIWKHVL